MKGDENAANGQLRFGRNEAGPSGRFLAAAEDARDPVGFGEQGGVDDAETQADGRLLDTADGVRRPQNEQERDEITQEDAAQQDVAQLASGRAHHRGVVVPQKDSQNLNQSRCIDIVEREWRNRDGLSNQKTNHAGE